MGIMQTLNERKTKISGTVVIPEELELGGIYNLFLKEVEVRSAEDCSNDDDTYDRVFKIRFNEFSDVVLEGKGKRIVGKKKNASQSQVLRWTLQQLWEQADTQQEFEDYYSEQMSKIIEYLKAKLT